MSEPTEAASTVAALAALADRTRKSLCEAGRPDLAEDLCAVVDPSGSVFLTTVRRSGYLPIEAVKALSIDPDWMIPEPSDAG